MRAHTFDYARGMRDVMREVMRGGRGYARSYARGFGGILKSYDLLCAPVFCSITMEVDFPNTGQQQNILAHNPAHNPRITSRAILAAMAVLGLCWGRPAATFWVQFGTGGSARGLGDRRLCPGRRWQVMRDHVGPLFRLCARLCARGRGYARSYARSLVALKQL